MDKLIQKLFESCIVKIIAGTQEGSGFFIAPGKIITCAHVIEEIYEHDLINVLWNGKSYQCNTLSFFPNPYPDIGILEFPSKKHPCVLFCDDVKIGDRLYSFGYSKEGPLGDSITFEFEGITNKPEQFYKLKGGQAIEGFSGAPIINLRTNRVNGVLKSSRDIYSELGGHVIPVPTIFKYNPILKSEHEKFHKSTNLWVGEIDDNSFNFLKSKVESGLVGLGYNILNERRVDYEKVDLFGELNTALQRLKLLIKIIPQNQKLDKYDIDKLVVYVNKARGFLNSAEGLMVVDNEVSSELKEYAEKQYLKLITTNELFKFSFNPDDVAQYLINSFESDELKNVYIELSCQTTEHGKGTIYKPVEKFFDDFLSKTKKLGIAVLGNFGSGKSSLCKHYSYLVAQDWVEGDKRFLPIYINLRDIRDFNSFEETLVQYLKDTYKVKASLHGVMNWLLHGNTLLILDGFDEMASKMDRLEIANNIRVLEYFYRRYKIFCILTCRTHFFKNQVEESALNNMLRLYILDWGSKELEDYVGKSQPTKKANSLNTIRTTYNLEELAKTPLFLNMITKTIDDIGDVINQAKLYQVYTDQWIQNQDYRSLITPEEKQIFMEEIALEMFSSDQLRIKHNLLEPKIRDLFPSQDYDYLKKLDKNIRTCTFLVRTPDGLYHFIHKSFMEFFTAFRLAKEVKSNNYENFERKLISFEIAGFFSNYFENEVEELIKGMVSATNSIARANFAISLGCQSYSEDIFYTLKLTIRKDKNLVVQQSAVDSLVNFNEEIVAKELALIIRNNEKLSNFTLRKIGSFVKYDCISQLFRDILSSESTEQQSIILDIIANEKIDILIEEVLEYIDRGDWKSNSDKIIQQVLKIRHSLILIFDLIKENSQLKKFKVFAEFLSTNNLEITYKDMKQSLAIKFKPEMERLVSKNRQSGISYNKNEGKIRNEFGIIADPVIKEILDFEYKTTYTKSKRDIEKEKRRSKNAT